MKYFFLLLALIFISHLAEAQPCKRPPCAYLNPMSLRLTVAFCTDLSEPKCFAEADLSQVIVSYRYRSNDGIKTHRETFTNLAEKGYKVVLPRQTNLQYMIMDHQIVIPALGLSYTITNIRFRDFLRDECSCPTPYISEVTIDNEVIIIDNYQNILPLTL